MGIGDRRWMRGVRDDLGAAGRSLRRDLRFSGLVVGVLGVAVALGVVVFAVVNAYLLRPLPYPAADRLVQVRTVTDVSWSEVDDVFEHPVSWDLDVFTLLGDDRPRMVRGAWVTPGFLEAYGIAVQPGGRGFLPEEGDPGAPPVALISHLLWQEHFGGDPDVVGRSFRAFTSDRPDHAESFRIVGVLPADLWHVNNFTEVLSPLRVDRSVYAGRLHPDLPLSVAEDRLTDLAQSTAAGLPEDFRVELVPLQESVVREVRPTLEALQAAALIVLLIACMNGTVLLLVRTASRSREFGVRRALGSPGLRLGRQLAGEGLLLAVAASILGLCIAAGVLRGVRQWIPAGLGMGAPGGFDTLRLDGTVLGATAAATLGMAAVFALAPTLLGLGRTALTRLGGSGRTPGRGTGLRSLLVGVEVALSMALLAGAGLMVRSAIHLSRQPLGFVAEGVTVGTLGLRQAAYPDPDRRTAFFDAVLEAVRARPEVEAAGLTASSPFSGIVRGQGFEAEDGGSSKEAVVAPVGDGYYATMGIPLVRGRAPDRRDGPGAEPVAIVSQDVAEALWPGLDPLGRRLRLAAVPPPGGNGEPGDWLTVVGVVGNIIRDMETGSVGEVYTSHRANPGFWMSLVIRRRTDHEATVTAVRDALAEFDPEVPFTAGAPLDDLVATARRPTRVMAGVLLTFAGFALVLSLVGLYGVVAYAARQRRRDVAIRMALGAAAGNVTRGFLVRGLAVVAAGVCVGALGGLALGRTLAGDLQGVGPDDPLTHLTVAVVLVGASTLAVWIPARRAARAVPMRVLREE